MDVEPLFLRGKEAADSGNFDYAIELFRDVLRMDPSHRNSRIALRGLEMKLLEARGGGKLLAPLKGLGSLVKMSLLRSKPEKVLDACEAYLVNDPTNVHVLLSLGRALQRLGHLEAAADALEFARQRRPNHLGVLRLQGEVNRALGQFDKSVRCYQTILSLKPSDREASELSRTVSAESHLKRSKMDESKSFREQLRDEKTANTLAAETRMVRTTQEVSDEFAHLRKAVEENPADPETHLRLGDALFHAERFTEAAAAYRKSFEIGKKWPAREKLGDTHLRILELAERMAEKEAEEGGRDPAAVAKAQEAKRKRLEFAIKEFELRRKQHPTDVHLAWRLGQYYFEAGGEANIQQAIQQFQQTMANSALKTRAQLMLGRCFAMSPKMLDMAKEQFAKAYEAQEDDAGDMAKTLLYELGSICEKMDQRADALTWYKKVYAVDAGYRDVAKKIQQLG